MTLEFESLMKVFFADQGTREQLLAQIAHIRRLAEEEAMRGDAFLREYAESGGPFPARLNIIGLVVGFLFRMNASVGDWAAWAEAEVNKWPDIHAPGDREMFHRLLERSESDVGRD